MGVSAPPSLTWDPGRLLVVQLRHLLQVLIDTKLPTAKVGDDRDLKSDGEKE